MERIDKLMAIVNPRSGVGRGMKYYRKFLQWLEKTGTKADIFLTEKTGERNAMNLARKGVRDGYTKILAIGGDGTINEIANGIFGSDVAVLPIRGGNGNDFAKAIGIPHDLEKAFGLIRDGRVEAIDVARVNNERIFVNVFGVGGIDTRVVDYVEGTLKKKCGFIPPKLLYLVGLVRELLRFKIKYPYLKLEVQEQGLPARIMEGEVTALVVGNGPFCGGIFRLTPQADLTDGLLDICWIKRTGRFRILKSIVKATKGTHLNMPEVETLADGTLPRLISFTVSSEELLPAEMDGENIPAAKKFKVTVIPQSLKVLVPSSLLTAQRPLMIKEARTPEFQPV